MRDYLFYYLFNFCLLNKKIVFLNSNLSLLELQKKLLHDDHAGNNKFTQISINRIMTRINRLVSQEILLQ